jgi:hypothetical protein
MCLVVGRHVGAATHEQASSSCQKSETALSWTRVNLRGLSFRCRRGPVMCETRGQPLSPIQAVREIVVGAVIVIGALLLLAGAVSGAVLRLGGAEGLATLWPLYLGGVVAILLGWINGEWRH